MEPARGQLTAPQRICDLITAPEVDGCLEVPVCLPIVGNLDEVAAAVVLMRCLGRMRVRVVPG